MVPSGGARHLRSASELMHTIAGTISPLAASRISTESEASDCAVK